MVPDILTLIARHLRPGTLLHLCMMNKPTYRLLRFTLYKNLWVDANRSPKAIKSFCSSITANTGAIGKHVTSVSIGDLFRCFGAEYCFVYKPFAPGIRAALRLMPNLKDLTLLLTPKALTLTLHALNPPFQLQRFVYSGQSTMPVIQFLMGQPTIIELEVRGYTSYGCPQRLRRALFQKPAYLPRLKKLTGPLSIVPILAPSRPVESIVLVEKSHLKPERLLGDVAAISAPLRSIYFISESALQPFWWPVMERLKSPSLLASLREIRIEEIICRLTGMKETKSVGDIAKQLARFEVLETLDLNIAKGYGQRDPQKLRVWLGGMSSLAAWNNVVPSLRQVALYGVQME